MELRMVVGADFLEAQQQDGTSVRVERRRVFLVGRLARMVNLRLIGRDAIDLDVEAVERAANASDSNYVINFAYARQLPSVTYSKPLLVMRTEKGELALLDGRQRADKAFSMGQRVVAAHVVTLEEALEHGLHPLASEFMLVRNHLFDSPEWPDIRKLLDEFGEVGIHVPVVSRLIERARQNGRRDLEGRLRHLLTLDEKGNAPAAGYRLLIATHPDPVVYDGKRYNSRVEHRFVIKVSNAKPVKRPARTPEVERLDQFFNLFCIEYIYTLQFIADHVIDRSPDFSAIRAQIRGKSREDFQREGQAYLQQIWRSMGLERYQIDQFQVMLQYAKATLVATDSGHGSIKEFQRALHHDLNAIMDDDDGPRTLREALQSKLTIIKAFCKAHIRARQWSSIQHKLRVMEEEFRATEIESRLLITLADKIHEHHELDPELDRTAVSELELFTISAKSGVVATHVYPHLAKLNLLCEGWTFYFCLGRPNSKEAISVSAGFVEASVHRAAMAASEEVDLMSDAWDNLLCELAKAGIDEHTLVSVLENLGRSNAVDSGELRRNSLNSDGLVFT